MTFTSQTLGEISIVAKELGVETAALLAVAEIESGGKAFAVIDGRQEPLIRFEAHHFDRRLSEPNRLKARALGLASPTAGAIPNPKTQSARWKLVAKAAAIDRKAAYESVSWGLGQVMGAHWAWLGYASIDALVEEARDSVAGQTRLMARFIDKSSLAPALKRRDWEAFARGYNGQAYKRHGYHTKIAAAYARYAESTENSQLEPTAAGNIRPSVAIPGKAPTPNRTGIAAWMRLIGTIVGLVGSVLRR